MPNPHSKSRLALFALFLGMGSESMADNIDELLNLSLSELMEVTIMSNVAKPIREQSGVVSVIEAHEIARSGARNLLDILKTVPGVWVGTDIGGLLSTTFRGIWGFEAKVLLLIDDIPQNEQSFGTLLLGNRYPAEMIKRIEIIRGPGSVSFGGQAELMVIKVTTKGAEQQGGTLSVSADISEDNLHQNNYVLTAGGALDNAWEYAVTGFTAQGDYTSARYNALSGASAELKNKSDVRPLHFNLGLNNDAWDMRVMYDRYRQEDLVGSGALGLITSAGFTPFSDPSQRSFTSLATRLAYRWQAGEHLRITPSLVYSDQTNWQIEYPGRYSHLELQRWHFDVNGVYELSANSNILAGVTAYREKHRPIWRGMPPFSSHTVQDYAVYFQYEADTAWADVTVGGRFEHNDLVGSAFVPRIALTKVWERLHTKLMYNEAFKIPQLSTVNTAETAGQPLAGAEDTHTVEWEVGYRLNDAWYLQGNLYWSEIQDYIAYDPFVVATVTAGDISTYGGEFQLQLRQNRWSADLGYSLFMLGDSNINTLTVAADNRAVLGIPNHKLSLNLGYKLDDSASLNLTATLVGGRYACVSDPEKWLCGEPQKLDVETDLTVFYRQAHKNWHYGIGIANLLDTDVRYAQPYRGGGAPIPGLGRRLLVNVEYRF